jgi:divalent metal cation (Fe/Co/Zn/Cd) transporter
VNYIIILVNFILQALLVGKSIAVALTGSLAITSTLLDSAVDVISSILLWCSNRAVQRTCSYLYPKGNLLILSSFSNIKLVYISDLRFPVAIEAPYARTSVTGVWFE